MNNVISDWPGKLGLVSCMVLVGGLAGCVGYVDGPSSQRTVYRPPPPVYLEARVEVQADYVYYPGYQVYYSSTRRHYVYQDGRSWVTRPSPPRVSVDVLFASPSVRLDFHDAPSVHHSTVVRQYPQHWTPPGWNHGNKNGHDEHNSKGKSKGKK
jgi:hypothetical protein